MQSLKQIQSTGLAETAIGSCLAPQVSLLMPLTGSTGPVVHLHGLTGLAKSSVKADLAIYSHMHGVSV